VILLGGGGLYFLLYSRFLPYRHMSHGIEVLSGKYVDPDAPGDITPLQALSSALAATVGMGNIGGVAIAIVVGGPGALFWMWVSALIGMATKFFTCTLSIMYRGRDSSGKLQGGPMYYITEGLGPKWKPLAAFFSFSGLVGCLPMFQANQLTQILRNDFIIPNGLATADAHLLSDFVVGLILVGIISIVIFGGIKRIGQVAMSLVPLMVLVYVGAVLYIISLHVAEIPYYLTLIVTDAFSGQAAAGGAVGSVIVTGFRRAAFSNEAGIGTEAMAHGAAQNSEPVREGLVGMLEPAIDTLLVCTMTALAILMTGVWQTSDMDGISLTSQAFSAAMPVAGSYILLFCVLVFSITTMFTYSYYGTKCLGFLIGAERQHYYNYFYMFSILFGSIASITAVISMIDGMFAMMAIPTMTATLLLSPKVYQATVDYFNRRRADSGMNDR
ncbi:MAG: alanine/glycine:cation symporter family protein, partial [Balneolales bacterium]